MRTADANSSVGLVRLAYIDVLGVISALGVVALHCNGCFWEGPAQGGPWLSANFIETLLYWPVPVFFMISGATLVGYRERMCTGEYLRRRFNRTVIPWLAWSLFALAYQVWRCTKLEQPLPELTPVSIVDGILNSRYNGIYWFFPPLFACYLSIPLLAAMVPRDRDDVLRLIAVAGVLLVSAIPFACKIAGIPWNAAFAPPPVTGYMLYVVLGYLLARWEPVKGQRLGVYALATVGWLVQMLGTLAVSSPETGVVGTYKGYLNLPAVMQAVGVFVAFRNVDWSIGLARCVASACGKLSSLTFGVYLVHWYLINLATTFCGVDGHSILWRTAGTLAVFCASALVAWALRKVPGLRRVVP